MLPVIAVTGPNPILRWYHQAAANRIIVNVIDLVPNFGLGPEVDVDATARLPESVIDFSGGRTICQFLQKSGMVLDEVTQGWPGDTEFE
jgi:hypothetical protein